MQDHKRSEIERKLRDLLSTENLTSEVSEELFAVFSDYIAVSDEHSVDIELMDMALAKLEEFHPELPDYDTTAGLSQFLNVLERQSAGTSRKRVWRVVKILAAVVAALVVAANAFGINPIQYIAETITFSLTPSGEMVLAPGSGSEYRSLQEALDVDGVAVGLPTWIPSEFSIDSVMVYEITFLKTYMASYASNTQELWIKVSLKDWEEQYVTGEKEDGGYSYYQDGKTYYILPNSESLKVYWMDGPYVCTINGNITKKQVERMIDSIQ